MQKSYFIPSPLTLALALPLLVGSLLGVITGVHALCSVLVSLSLALALALLSCPLQVVQASMFLFALFCLAQYVRANSCQVQEEYSYGK